MPGVLADVEAELRRYKALAEAAIAQLDDEALAQAPTGDNSVATIAWHISGNLKSRFTDFLTSDGEKPWRDRESEFEPRAVASGELLAKWEDGWGTLLASLGSLTDDDLTATVSIRGVPLSVLEALLRALGHIAYHVGQIVYLARVLKGEEWRYLSIPPGGSEDYNRDPVYERASDHAARARGRFGS